MQFKTKSKHFIQNYRVFDLSTTFRDSAWNVENKSKQWFITVTRYLFVMIV